MADDASEPRTHRTNGWTGGQHSVWRLALGLTLAWLVARTLVDTVTAAGFDGGAARIRREDRFELRAVELSAPVATALLGALGLACVALAVGWRDRWMALVLAAALAASGLPLGGDHGSLPWQALLLLVVHALMPKAPYGSLDARGRADPGGGWRAPELVRQLLWIASPVIAAALVAYDVRWLFGADAAGAFEETARRELERGSPLARLIGASAASVALLRVAQAAAVVMLLLPVAAALPRVRRLAWCALAAVVAATCVVGWRLDFGVAVLTLWLVLLFDPAWIPPRATGVVERLFYDGECGLCLRSVRFVLAEDADGRAFRFAPLQGETFARALDRDVRAELPDSVVVLASDGRVLVRSNAAIRVLERLGGLWRVLGTLARLVPRPVRDAAYDLVASVRERAFAKPATVCPLGPRHVAERFDP